MGILGSKTHTAGDTRRWTVLYGKWLDNAATIVSADATSSSATCTVDTPTVLGREIQFFVDGGTVGETATVTLVMTDSFANVKTDTISFTVIAP